MMFPSTLLLTILFTTLYFSQLVLSFPFQRLITNRATDEKICNGHPEFCNKKYSELVYIGAHNSYADGIGLSDNQNK